jgi:hypothetical protein
MPTALLLALELQQVASAAVVPLAGAILAAESC